MNRADKAAGQTLIEVLIATAIVILVLVALVAGVAGSLKSAQYARDKARAAFLAQEALEWIRSQVRQVSWREASSWASGGGTSYCLTTLDFNTVGNCTNLIGGVYDRQATLTLESLPPPAQPTYIKVKVAVAWSYGSQQFTSPVDAIFYRWDTTSK